MLRVLLIRPGSTEYDRQGRIQGNLDIPLSDDGRQQVEKLVAQIETDPLIAIYCGPSRAAQQTAALVGAAAELKPKVLEGLENLNHGLWQGMLIDDVRTKQPKVYRRWQEEPQTVCPPQGETVAAARKRVETAISKITRKQKDALVAIVVANPLASIVRHVLTGDHLCDLWNPSNQLASWELIDRATLPTPHLAPGQ
jgi:phosphoserine phosphatase